MTPTGDGGASRLITIVGVGPGELPLVLSPSLWCSGLWVLSVAAVTKSRQLELSQELIGLRCAHLERLPVLGCVRDGRAFNNSWSAHAVSRPIL